MFSDFSWFLLFSWFWSNVTTWQLFTKSWSNLMGSDIKAAVDADTVFSCWTVQHLQLIPTITRSWINGRFFFSSFYYACCRSVSIFFGFCQLNLYFYYHVYTQTFLLNHMINKNMPNLEGVFVCSVIHMHTYSTHRERGCAQKGYNTLNISVQKCSCTWHIHTFKNSNIHENSISHGNMQYAMQSQNKYIIH